MEQVILVRYGEIALKGLNRPIFEDRLVKNIKKALDGLQYKISKSQARIYIEPIVGDAELGIQSFDIHKIIDSLTRVYGVVSVSPAIKVASTMDDIKSAIDKLVLERNKPITFKVEAKREDKAFKLTSPQICADLGEYVLSKYSNFKVDVINPELKIYVEVRTNSYVYTDVIEGCGGMPLGTNGKAMLLLSGGIDSPVAGWSIAKRGVELEAIHFISPPYTSQRATEKVIELCKILEQFADNVKLHIIPFTDIQLEIREKCPENQLTIIMRRFMMRIAQKVAKQNGCSALVTGENIGQVASQTMESLVVTNAVVDIPVFRPLIAMDKNEIVTIAKKIGTYETSILPYEDCCTVFLPKRPETKPKLEKIEASESHLDVEGLIDRAISESSNCDM